MAEVTARDYASRGCRRVVDLDPEKFFERVNRDIMMPRPARRIGDKKRLKLAVTVRETKSKADRPWKRKLLGYGMKPEKIRAGRQSRRTKKSTAGGQSWIELVGPSYWSCFRGALTS